jgi:hypothetical protein
MFPNASTGTWRILCLVAPLRETLFVFVLFLFFVVKYCASALDCTAAQRSPARHFEV